MSSALELLELRLKNIEDQVLGSRVAIDDKWRETGSDVISELVSIDNRLRELTTGKERFNNCYQKCEQLKKYLDNEYIDRLVGSDSAKLEQIVNFEQQIRSESNDLKRVEQLAKNIDSVHIRSCDKFETKLKNIRLICLKQSQQSVGIEDKTKQLVLSYNQWIQTIKSQLKDWDQLLTQLETKRKTNKSKLDID